MAKFKIFNPKTGKDEAVSDSAIKQRTKKSAQWFRDSIRSAFESKRPAKDAKGAQTIVADGNTNAALNRNATINDPEFKKGIRTVKAVEVGSLYMYLYDAKHKKTLPYYDKFPLTLVLGITSDGFIGLNFHYLPYVMRANLFQALEDKKRNVTRRGKREQRYKVSYQILKGSRANKYLAPTIKQYLFTQVRSPFVEVFTPDSREMAIFLPTERFSGAGRSEVWSDSKGKV